MSTPLAATDWAQMLARSPLQQLDTPQGLLQYRSAGQAPSVTHVLLHGIGSASASWALQLQAAQGREDLRVLAWDAPGYGASAPLAPEAPLASDYAQRLWDWLQAFERASGVDTQTPWTLVGHSLGALMAASAARQQPARVHRLVLLSPACGYGDASAQEREDKLANRLALLHKLGPQGMAEQRAAAMLSPQAAPQWVAAVRETMAQIDPAGYSQAARMLAQGVLQHDLAAWSGPLSVASGEVDTITPPAACARVAREAGQRWLSLGPVGHACPLEAAAAVNALLGLDRAPEKAHP